MSLGSKSSYRCPYRFRHNVRGTYYSVVFYCRITKTECKYKPNECPILRRLRRIEENKQLTQYIW